MSKTINNIGSKLLKIGLVLMMVVTTALSDMTVVNVKAATSDAMWANLDGTPYTSGDIYLDMKDNLQIDSKSDMYSLLTGILGEADTRFLTDNSHKMDEIVYGKTLNYPNDAFSLAVGKHTAQRGNNKGRFGTRSYDDPISFEVRLYSNIVLDIEGIPTNAKVTIGGKDYTTDQVIKVYHSEGAKNVSVTYDSAKYSVAYELGGQARETVTSIDVTQTKSVTLKVTFAEKSQASTVNVSHNEGGSVTFNNGNTLTGLTVNPGNYNIVATPSTNYYVSDIKVNGNSVNNISYNNTVATYVLNVIALNEYSVEVIFAEKKLDYNPTANIKFNPSLGIASQLDAVKQEIFNNVIKANESLPEGLTKDMLTYQYYPKQKVNLWGSAYGNPINLENDGSNQYYFGEQFKDNIGQEEKILVTWPGNEQYPSVSIDATITLVEGRNGIGIISPDSINLDIRQILKNSETKEERIAAITTAILNEISPTTNPSGLTLTNNITKVVTDSYNSLIVDNAQLLIDDKIKIEFAGNTTYAPASKFVDVTLTNKVVHNTFKINNVPADKGSISISDEYYEKDSNNNIIGLKGLTDIIITAVPIEEYVVKTISVQQIKDEIATDLILDVKFNADKTAYVTLAPSGEDVHYIINAEFTAETIAVKDATYNYNGYYETTFTNKDNEIVSGYTLTKEDIFDLVYNQEDSGLQNLDLNSVTVKVNDQIIDENNKLVVEDGKEYSVVIEYKQQVIYDEVSEAITVYEATSAPCTLKAIDTRQESQLTLSTQYNSDIPYDTSEYKKGVFDFININHSGLNELRYNDSKITIPEVTISIQKNTPTPILYEVTFIGDENYKPTKETLSVYFITHADESSVVMTSTSNQGVLSGTDLDENNHIPGLRNTILYVTPNTGYSIRSIEVVEANNNGEGAEKAEGITITYNNGVAIITFETTEENELYTLKVEYVENNISINEPQTYYYNGNEYDQYTLDKEELFNLVYDRENSGYNWLSYDNEFVDVYVNGNAITAANPYVTLHDDMTYSIRIKYNGWSNQENTIIATDEQYAEVSSIDYVFTASDSRSETEIIANNVGTEENPLDIRDILKTNASDDDKKANIIDQLKEQISAYVKVDDGSNNEANSDATNNMNCDLLPQLNAIYDQLTVNNAVVNFEVTYMYSGTDTNEPSKEKIITIWLENKIIDNTLTVINGIGDTINKGTISFNDTDITTNFAGFTTNTIEVIPTPIENSGVQYAVSYIDISYVDSNGNEVNEDHTVVYDDGKAIVTFDGLEDCEYTVKVTYEKYGFNINDNATVKDFDQDATIATKENDTDSTYTKEELENMVEEAVIDSFVSSNSKDEFINTYGNLNYSYNATNALADNLPSYQELSFNPNTVVSWFLHKFGHDSVGTDLNKETVKVAFSSKNEKYKSFEITKYVSIEYKGSLVVNVQGDASLSLTGTGISSYGKVLTKGEAVKLSQGSYALKVTPSTNRYIKSITISSNIDENKSWKIMDNDSTNPSYDNTVGTFAFDANGSEQITVNVEVGTVSLATRDSVNIRYNPANTEDILTEEEIFDAVVNIDMSNPSKKTDFFGDNSLYATTIDIKDGLTLEDFKDTNVVEKEITITATSTNEIYPDVTVKKTVTFTDLRTPTRIENNEINDVVEFKDQALLTKALKDMLNPVVYENISLGGIIENAECSISFTTPTKSLDDGKLYTDVTITYPGNITYRHSSKVIKNVEVSELPENTYIQFDSAYGNAILDGKIPDEQGIYELLGNSFYKIVITPDKGYAVDSIVIKDTTTNENYDYNFEYSDYKNLVASYDEFKFVEEHNYTILVNYFEPKFIFKENAELGYCYGIDSIPTVDDIYNATVENPTYSSDANISLEYLARPTSQYTVNLPELGKDIIPGVDLSSILNLLQIPTGVKVIEFKEIWAEPDAKYATVDLQKTVNDAYDKLINEIAKININDLNIGNLGVISAFTEYRSVINNLGNTTFGTHEFGELGDGSIENIRVSYKDNKQSIALTNTKLTIIDDRISTTITGNDCTLPYGFTADELISALNATILGNDGLTVDGNIDVVTSIKGLDASETPYKIIVKYAGNETYQQCTATFNVTVTKAPCEITYNSQIVTIGDNYDFGVITNPAGVSTIDFMLGIDISSLSTDNLIPTGYLQLKLPGLLGSIFNGEMGLQEFINTITGLVGSSDSILESLGISKETLDTLINAVNSISEQLGDIDLKIKFNGNMKPTNIGAYLAGSISYDPNYETAFGLGYLVIVPKTTKAELKYTYTPSNSVFSANLIQDGVYDLSAEAFIDEVKSNSATGQIRHLFVRFDAEGNFKFLHVEDNTALKTDENMAELTTPGAYAQLSLLTDWGNQLYYAMPIARGYLVFPETVDVQFTGDSNQSYVYNGEQHAFDATITDKEGNEITNREPLTITYVGVDAKGIEFYNSTTPPSNVGAYAVIATYIDEENELYGAAFGTLLITPAKATIEVPNETVTYDENFMFNVNTDPENVDYALITLGVESAGDFNIEGFNAINGVVNIDLPEWADKLLDNILPEEAYSTGISFGDLYQYKDELTNYLKEQGIDSQLTEAIIEFVLQNYSGMEGIIGSNEDIIQNVINAAKAGNVFDYVIEWLERYVDDELELIITFKDKEDLKPINVGIYGVGAIILDPNYIPAYDFGYTIVMPKEEKGTMVWADSSISSIPYGDVDKYNLDAIAKTDSGKEISPKWLVYGYLEVIGADNYVFSFDKPTKVGSYIQMAVVLGLDSTMYSVAPVYRMFSISLRTTQLEFGSETEFTYDGTPHGLTATLLDKDANNTALPQEEQVKVTYFYEGKTAAGESYGSEEAPVDAGEYTVKATYEGSDIYTNSTATKLFTIKQADVQIEILDDSKFIGEEDPNISNKYDIVNGQLLETDDVNITISRLPGETAKEYTMDFMLSGNDIYNYHITSTNKGTFTINKRNVYVEFNSLEKVYGTEDPTDELKATVKATSDNLYSPHTIEDIIAVTYEREHGEDVGTYTLTPAFTINNNSITVNNETITFEQMYNVEIKGTATLTITPKSIAEAIVTGTNQTYTGNVLTTDVTVILDGKTLIEGTDYTVSYSDNVNVSDNPVITITGIGNYKDTATGTFTIVAKDITNDMVSDLTDKIYTGEAITQTVTVTDGTTELNEGSDYTITYSANTEVGDVTVTITGTGNYKGTVTKSFNITEKSINGFTVEYDDEHVYTGSDITPEVVVKDGETVLTADDYTVAYTNNISTGTAIITIKGNGNYKDTITKEFTIKQKDIADTSITVNELSDMLYTGNAIYQNIIVTDTALTENKQLNQDTHYEISYSDNTIVGTAKVTITGIGNYTGTKEVEFNIIAASITEEMINGFINQKEYTGEALTQNLNVLFNDKPLTENTDYTVEYANNTNAGKASVTITGTGNYSGSVTLTYTITPKSIEDMEVDGVNTQYFYTGSEINPEVTIQGLESKDYTVEYGENNQPGTGTVTIKGAGNYTGTIIKEFSIVKKDLKDTTISSIADQVFNRGEFTPGFTVKYGNDELTLDTDFTVEYTDNVNVGIATVTITGKGIYTGTNSITFNITAKEIAEESVSGIEGSYFYTGEAIEPEVTVSDGETTLVLGEEYTVKYDNNTNVGSATVTITGTGNYKGTVTKTFTIAKKDISETEITTIDKLIYTGSALEPEVTVTLGDKILVKDEDYTVSYSNNINVTDEAVITITGTGIYAGTKTATFIIEPKVLENTMVSDVQASVQYNGTEIKQTVAVKDGDKVLVEGTDYTVTYINVQGDAATASEVDYINVGTVKIMITGINNYSGTIERTYDITTKPILNHMISRLEQNIVYTGQAITQDIVVTDGTTILELNKDYTLTYVNNTNVGTATVTITGIGNYSGTISKKFTIAAKDISGDTVEGIVDMVFDGNPIVQATLKVIDSIGELIMGRDYYVYYQNNVHAGSANIIIEGIGNFIGTIIKNFTISSKSINDENIEISYDNVQIANGKEIKPQVIIKDNNKVLINGTDYVIAYKDNVKVGTASMTITGIGNYKDEVVKTFRITNSITDATVNGISDKEYTGNAITQNITVVLDDTTLVLGTDYTVTYTDNVDSGKATITIEGINNYSGEIVKTFKITQKSISDMNVDGVDTSYEYNGNAYEPDITLTDGNKTLQLSTDYIVEYMDNVNVGYAVIRIKGVGNYTGTIIKTFKINSKAIDNMIVEGADGNYIYNGNAYEPSITLKDGTTVLVLNQDYTLGYIKNVDAGVATIKIIGIGNYTGMIEKTFEINAKSIEEAEVSGIVNKDYTGEEITQDITVTLDGKTLVLGTDYQVTYENNTNVGTATVTITGIENYTGTISKTFLIEMLSIKDAVITGITDKTYNGSAQEQNITVVLDNITLEKDSDYTVTYENNTNVGTAIMTIAGAGRYKGTATIEFKINPLSIEGAEVNGIENKVYNGLYQEQDITVTVNGKELVNGTDYEVKYQNHINAGQALMLIEGKGNYTGSINTGFSIEKADNSWITTPYIKNWVNGETPSTPAAKAQYGNDDLVLEYYSNAQCTQKVTNITSAGTYYLKASVVNQANYKDLVKVYEFKVIKNIYQVLDDNNIKYNLESTKQYVHGFEVGTTVQSLITKLSNVKDATLVSFTDAKGNAITTGTVSTGMIFKMKIGETVHTRTIVIIGDVNGDGRIRSNDYVLIRNYIMEEGTALTGAYMIAADINRDSKVRSNDYVFVRNHIMDEYTISQK